MLEEQLKDLAMSLLSGHRQRTCALTALVVDIRPGREEDVSDDEVTLPAGGQQGRPVPPVHAVDLGAVEEKNLYDVGVSLPGRNV